MLVAITTARPERAPPRRPRRYPDLSRLTLFLAGIVTIVPSIGSQAATIAVQWDPVLDDPRVAGYEIHVGWRSGVYEWVVQVDFDGAATDAALIDNLVRGNTYYLAIRARNESSSLVSEFSNEISITVDSVSPYITANGEPGFLTLPRGEMLHVDVELEVGRPAAGTGADWWVAALNAGHWYSYLYPARTWVSVGGSYSDLIATYQGPLNDLAPYEVLHYTGLGIGHYTVYFGVDTDMNGVLDVDQLYVDKVVIDIQ